MKRIAVIGSSGAIGNAFVHQLAEEYLNATIYSFSRTPSQMNADNLVVRNIDYESESSISAAAELSAAHEPLDLVIVCTGILHDNEIMPEKSLRELSADKFQRLFHVNTVVPALIAKHFVPVLDRSGRSVLAILSARIGSISDNRLGGWYSYRASKAALNMIIKTAAIETARNNSNAIVVGLHPGTVDSALSKPFQRHVPAAQLFTPEYSVEQLLIVIKNLTPTDSGKCFAFDGEEIAP